MDGRALSYHPVGDHAFWMQTTGAVLVVNQQCSPVRMSMPVQGGRGAHRLLYLAAVRNLFRLAMPAWSR